jgi:hypothetical protein
VKPVEHGRERDRYSYGVVVRDSAPWETVKPINVAVKMKTELFSSALILPARYRTICPFMLICSPIYQRKSSEAVVRKGFESKRRG